MFNIIILFLTSVEHRLSHLRFQQFSRTCYPTNWQWYTSFPSPQKYLSIQSIAA